MTARALAALAVIAAPRTAAACAVCLDSAFGDRGFNWAFVALMLTPFAVAGALGCVLARCVRQRRVDHGEAASSEEVRSC
jgi:hypothetical protein